MEGLMMIGPSTVAMAVRKGDGSIHVETSPVGSSSRAAKIPFIRGSVKIFRQMVTGTGYLMKSAEFAEEALSASDDPAPAEVLPGPDVGEAENAGPVPVPVAPSKPTKAGKGPGRLERFIERHSTAFLYLSVIFGLCISIGLFILLPNLISSLTLNRLIGKGTGFGYQVLRSLFEGVIRIGIFIAYLALASRMKDIARVWMYHGAEHKTIACYESRLPLTVENVRQFSKHHPRCGTTFMFIVLLMSIILFSFVPRINIVLDMVIRLALVPVLAGLSYELIHWTARYDNPVTRAVSRPGLWLQRLTTREPDDSMIEVAIAAMIPVIPAGERGDEW